MPKKAWPPSWKSAARHSRIAEVATQRETAAIAWRGRALEIEHVWIQRELKDAPLIVFLHDGLGSISMWRNFPQLLCERLGCRGLMFSRYGYGHSSWRSGDEQWGAEFLQVQATELIPAFLRALGVREPLWLYGQSDGGSIALMMAALRPVDIAGVVVTAPHTFIEFITAKGIADAREAFMQGDLRRGLAKHHRDPDAVMQGWGNSWLAPSARDWSIVPLLSRIRCPLLAMQGEHDHYGSMEQIRIIARQAPQARLLEIENCGHISHQDRPELVLHAAANFVLAAGPQAAQRKTLETPHWPYPPAA
jgi:pimeloyl-ACP methyl ester carboxylesterase